MSIVFLCGVDMNPQSIRSRPELASARFIGIGSIEARSFPEFATPLDRIWGIVLESAGQPAGSPVTILSRDGSVVEGLLISGKTDIAVLDLVIAEARYWELPVAWWQSLKRT